MFHPVTILSLTAVVAVLLPVYGLASLRSGRRRRRRGGVLAANDIAEGTREFDSLVPDINVPARYLVAKRGSDSAHFTLAGVGDHPIGICEDQSSVSIATPGLPLRVSRLGIATRTKKVAINSNVAQDDFLVPAANGYAQTLPTSAGTYWVLGQADQTGAASGVTNSPTYVEFIACLPYKVTI